MDYETSQKIRDEIKKYIEERSCPACKADTTFVKVDYWPDEGDNGSFLRCMKCLGLFKETIVEVEE